MRRFLLLIPVALALVVLWLLNDDDAVTRTSRDAGSVEQPSDGASDGAPPSDHRETSAHTTNGASTATTAASTPAADAREDDRSHALSVLIRDERGTPTPGIVIKLKHGADIYDKQTTGGEGLAKFYASHRAGTVVYIDRGWFGRRFRIGEWDGRPGRTRLEATLYRPRNVIVRVRVDGVPGLPSGFKIEEPNIAGAQVFADSGEIRGQLVTVTHDVPIHLRASTRFLVDPATCTLKDHSGALEATIDYKTAVPVFVRGYSWDTARDLRFETQQEDGTWGTAFGWRKAPLVPKGERGKHYYFGLRPGHHRIVLHTLGIPIREFDVREGASKVRVEVRLSGVRWVRTEFSLPSGYASRDRVGVLVRGPDIAPGTQVAEDAKFLHPGDREIELKITGPGLRPHPTRGTVHTSSGGRFTLTAIAGASATLRCDDASKVRIALHDLTAPHNTAYSATAERSPTNQFLFLHVPEGTYHVVVDPEGSAPTLLENIAFPGGQVDLGAIGTGPGTRLAIELKNRKKNWVSVQATWLPIEKRLDYAAAANRGQRIFTGLPPGKLRLSFTMGDRKWSRIVTTTISGKLSIEVDCAGE